MDTRVVALDADVKNSTFSDKFEKVAPDRFYENFIAEQVMVGAASQHYRAELTGFFGIDLAELLPFNLMRTWHVQLAIFWVATSPR